MTSIHISIDGNRYEFAGGKACALELARYLSNALYIHEKPVAIKVSEEFPIDPTDTGLNLDDYPTRLDINGEGELE